MLANSLRRFSCIALLLVMQSTPSLAQQGKPFEVESVNSQLNDTVYFLNAVFAINLPDHIVNAIEQGFDLPLAIEIEVYRYRPMWFDQRVVYIKQQYRIAYHAFLDEFSVFNVNAGYKAFYPTLDKAVNGLVVLIDYPALDNNALMPGEQYSARLRIGIDGVELPLPLKSSSFWKNDWDLISDWAEWTLK